MALRILKGRSGSGKSTYLCDWILKQSRENPDQNYFVIVPDQFTMQTQMDFVTHSTGGGIMNIDVLSFSRLGHRIFEETGSSKRLVLDDTGKSLILRKIAASYKEQMPVIGTNMQKQGYIHEVKSAISEFMQYGVGKKEMEILMTHAKKNNRKALLYKLQDLQYIYDAFLAYIQDHYITTEESMTLLAKELFRSSVIKDSVIVFDGFTGFTPVQEDVIRSLLLLCQEVIITVTMDDQKKNASLFSFSMENVHSLKRIAQQENVRVTEKEIQTGNRFNGSPMLAYLEENIFRYPIIPYEDGKEREAVQVHSASDVKAELRIVCRKIHQLVTETDCAYRDIAVIAGDFETYKSEVEEEFTRYHIPFYLDETRGILLNPMTEFIKAALQIQCEDYSYLSVFTYLKTGMTDFTEDEIDDLENYVLELNIRGKKTWHRVFARRTKEMKKRDSAIDELEYLNGLRQKLIDSLERLSNCTCSVKEHIVALYEFLVSNRVEEKLRDYVALFKEEDFVKEKEYEQIYGLVMDLFDQMEELLGEEKISTEELLSILEAGFTEMEVGSIPRSVDRVIVGDMERTRLKPVKHLFLVGANDGWIPKNAGKGGIISDLDREFLKETEVALSPTPREEIQIQRFYLYLQLTKPSDSLSISYTKTDLQGSPLKPSYLVGMVEQLFPGCNKSKESFEESLPGNDFEIKEKTASLLFRYVENTITKEEQEELYVFRNLVPDFDDYMERAFYVYQPETVEQSVAAILYGAKIMASVSKMEKYASCAYAHFLQYGLELKEREKYGLEGKDIGSIFHATLENFVNGLQRYGCSLVDFEEETGEKVLDEAFENACTGYSEALSYENATFRYEMTRMKNIMHQTVFTLAKQLRKGDFKPAAYEIGFHRVESIDDLQLEIKGRIDRLDTYEENNKIYVKVIDYKSGDRDFDLLSFYEGQQLQLIVYLGEAVKKLEKENPGKQVLPAAALYYHMSDPLVDVKEAESDEAIKQQVFESLKTKGILTTDPEALSAMDREMNRKSDVIPLGFKTNGEFTAASKVLEPEDLELLYEFALHRIRQMGKEMTEGHMEKNPCRKGQNDSCTYCSFRSVCDFDERKAGFVMREPAGKDNAAIMEQIRSEMEKQS